MECINTYTDIILVLNGENKNWLYRNKDTTIYNLCVLSLWQRDAYLQLLLNSNTDSDSGWSLLLGALIKSFIALAYFYKKLKFRWSETLIELE